MDLANVSGPQGGGPAREHRRTIPSVSYEARLFDDRSTAVPVAHRSRVLAVVQSAGKQKWALLRCPCGCGENLALNLMHSHRPVWGLSVDASGKASLRPSVHATKCGAHFWLRNGTVIWCA
ncbi:MAG: DUF6527 family protein [Bryobacteraceae bacterium]